MLLHLSPSGSVGRNFANVITFNLSGFTARLYLIGTWLRYRAGQNDGGWPLTLTSAIHLRSAMAVPHPIFINCVARFFRKCLGPNILVCWSVWHVLEQTYFGFSSKSKFHLRICVTVPATPRPQLIFHWYDPPRIIAHLFRTPTWITTRDWPPGCTLCVQQDRPPWSHQCHQAGEWRPGVAHTGNPETPPEACSFL